MALQGDERRLIDEANMHLPGRQVDPEQVQRDLWRLGQWERARLARAQRREAEADAAAAAPARRRQRRHECRLDPPTRVDGLVVPVGSGRHGPSTSSTTPAPLVDGPARAAARAQLKGIGYDDEALSKPIVGVAYDVDRDDAVQLPPARAGAKVKEGIRAAGGTPMEFNTIAISDGITMGTSGMRASLVSREVIADSIELVARGHFFDAIVCLAACDKTIPGAVMALARLDMPGADALRRLDRARPLPGRRRHDPRRLRGDRRARCRQDDRRGARASSSTSPAPGAGACGGQFTANTMAMAFEVLGISPMGSAMVPAENPTQGRRRLRGRRGS